MLFGGFFAYMSDISTIRSEKLKYEPDETSLLSGTRMLLLTW
jgi:hypothetical protein